MKSEFNQLREVLRRVGDGLVERDEAVRLLVLAALSGEHLLLIGPPGTAKSELARRLHQIFGGRYFERLLTRFSVPEELFGPLSLAALDEGRYERDIAGYLPSSSIAFLDEVFKANSAILNALLTLLNEREFDQGAQRIPVPLVSLVAASNEVPDDETLRAFQDRFLLRCIVRPVTAAAFADLLGLEPFETQDNPILTEQDIIRTQAVAKTVALPPEIAQLLSQLRASMLERQIEISDRRWVRAVHLLKVSAATNGRQSVDADDLWLLKALVGDRDEHAKEIEDWFCELLGAREALDPVWAARVAEAFEQQIEREESATELAFDDSGKLSLVKSKTAAQDEAIENAAPRISPFSQRKRFSASHMAARIAQIDQACEKLTEFLDVADSHRERLCARLQSNLWLPDALAARVSQTLDTTTQRLREQQQRLAAIRQRYCDLPVTEVDDGVAPDPLNLPERPGFAAN